MALPHPLPCSGQDEPGQASALVQALADMVVHRLFGVGLVLQSAADLADGPAGARLAEAAEELDAIIRDARTAAFDARAYPHPRDGSGP